MKPIKLFLTMILFFSFSIMSAKTEKDSTDNFQKTDEVLSKAVEKAITLAEKTGDFVIEQAPDLIQQFYTWHIASDIFWIFLGFLIFLVGRYLPYIWLDQTEEASYSNDAQFFKKWGQGSDGVAGAWVIYATGIIIAVIIALVNLYDLVYLMAAPKLYIIEYFIDKAS